MNRLNRRSVILLGVALALLGLVGFHYWSIWSPFRRAERACANRNWSLAIQILGPFLDRYPNHMEAHLVMARALFGKGEWREGLEHLRQIPESSRQLAEARYYEGSVMLELHRGAQAERALRACLTLDPQSVPARQQLVTLLLWEDRWREGRKLAWELYDLAPPEHRAEALSQLFRVDYGEFPAEVRRTRLERFVAQNPRDWNAVAALASLYSSDPDEMTRARALPMLREALQQQPENTDCRMALITLAVVADHEHARQLLDTWPAESRDEQFLLARGIIQQECELDFAKAAESFRRFLDNQPDRWKVRGRLAVCLRMLDQPDQASLQMARQARISETLKEDAIRELIEAQATQLGTVSLRYRLGQLYENVGRYKEARCWYDESLRVQPTHEASKNAIERLKDKPDVLPVDEP